VGGWKGVRGRKGWKSELYFFGGYK